ncbi:MAG: alanine:cation symporter family protein, partial [Pseudomonadales bacterium]
VILTTVYSPEIAGAGVQGVELTSRAFGGTIAWSTIPLSIITVLFAFSTLIAWSYYGLKGWTYLVGDCWLAETSFKLVFCAFAVLGCTIKLDAVLAFSDALVFVIALPNIIALYLLAPIVKRELLDYQRRLKSGHLEKTIT